MKSAASTLAAPGKGRAAKAVAAPATIAGAVFVAPLPARAFVEEADGFPQPQAVDEAAPPAELLTS
jgi:hypothetical protein